MSLNNVQFLNEQQLQRLKSLPQDKISQGVVVLLLLYIAYIVAELTWMVAPMPEQAAVKVGQYQQASSRSSAVSRPNISSLTSMNLFGVAQEREKEEVQAPIVEDAPKTNLNLRLTGIVAVRGNDSGGSAIIENANKQETYFVDDTVNGTSAKVVKILADRVLLQVGSRVETLMLDGIEYSRFPGKEKADPRTRPNSSALTAKSNRREPAKRVSTRDAKKIDNRGDKKLTEKLARKKRELLENPGKILDFINAQPFMKNGKLYGYRVRPAKDPQLFVSTGLRSNDIAIEINGYQLSDMQQAMSAMKELREMTEANIVVERRGKIVEVLFSVDMSAGQKTQQAEDPARARGGEKPEQPRGEKKKG